MHGDATQKRDLLRFPVFQRLLVVLLVPLALSSIAFACVCVGPPRTEDGIADWLQRNDFVLLGQVVEIEYEVVQSERSKYWKNTIHIRALEGIKGIDDGAGFTMIDLSILCGPEILEGNTYLIFSSKREGENFPVVSGCSHFLYDARQGAVPKHHDFNRTVLDYVLVLLRKAV